MAILWRLRLEVFDDKVENSGWAASSLVTDELLKDTALGPKKFLGLVVGTLYNQIQEKIADGQT